MGSSQTGFPSPSFQTERQRVRETESQRVRETERQRDRETESLRERETAGKRREEKTREEKRREEKRREERRRERETEAATDICTHILFIHFFSLHTSSSSRIYCRSFVGAIP
jgi:hypothetical protein